MKSTAYALARAEMIRALSAYEGTTTADGAGDGTTLIDSNLIGRNDFVSEKTILILSGDSKDEDKGAASFDNVTGTITLQGTGFSAQIKAGTTYRVLNISTVEIDVANINSKIGTNTDPAGTTTLFAWLANLFGVGSERQGLVYYGKVTQVDDATHFRVSELAGFGDAFFANTYRVYVVRDAGGAGAAPQGEMQPCSGYDSTDAIFTHTAFSAGLAVDDEILLIQERVAQIADLLADIGDASGSTLGSIYAILGNPAQSFLSMIGYEGATSLANKLSAARAAYLDNLSAGAVALASVCTAARLAELDAANLPADIDTLLSRVKVAVFDFWSDVADKITINDDDPSVADIVFPSVVVDALPTGSTVARVIAMLKFRAIKNTHSGAANMIEDAGKTIRVMKSNGTSWGTDDIVAINFDQNQWYTEDGAKEGGDVMIGDNDISGKVTGVGTYEFQSHEADGRNDAIHALFDSLELYDVQMGLRFYLET